jgi:hypothetical protein
MNSSMSGPRNPRDQFPTACPQTRPCASIRNNKAPARSRGRQIRHRKFADPRRRIALQQVVADKVKDRDERRDKILIGSRNAAAIIFLPRSLDEVDELLPRLFDCREGPVNFGEYGTALSSMIAPSSA